MAPISWLVKQNLAALACPGRSTKGQLSSVLRRKPFHALHPAAGKGPEGPPLAAALSWLDLCGSLLLVLVASLKDRSSQYSGGS